MCRPAERKGGSSHLVGGGAEKQQLAFLFQGRAAKLTPACNTRLPCPPPPLVRPFPDPHACPFPAQVRNERILNNLGKQFQGDVSQYTEDALKKRMALRRHPGIATAIERWWGVMPKSNRLVVAKELERVDRFGYAEMHVNIQVGGGSSNTALDPHSCSNNY